MPSQTLKDAEKALEKIVSRPLPEIITELEQVAARDSNNPAPHLIMAMVSGFAHRNVEDSKRHFSAAERLVQQGGGRRNAEREFSESLLKVLKIEYDLDEISRRRKGATEVDEAERRALAQAKVANRNAMKQMDRTMRQLRSSKLCRVAYGALLALSQTTAPSSAEYRRGMTKLGRETGDLATFFRMYGYRKNHSYSQAIRVGKALEQRNPASPLVKVMLGSCHFYNRRDKEAEGYYEKAVSLAPNDPHVALGYAIALNRTAKLDKAKTMIGKAESLDRARKLTPMIKEVKTGITIKEEI